MRKTVITLSMALALAGICAGSAEASSTWSPEPIPLQAPSSLTSVSCVTASFCMAVGVYVPSGGQTTMTALSWDGSAWTQLALSAVPGGSLTQVSCATPAMCIALGSYVPTGSTTSVTLAERWNGQAWRMIAVPDGLTQLSCTAANACVAVGDPGTQAEEWTGLSGQRWSALPSPATVQGAVPYWTGISCTSASDCVAVGDVNSAGVAEQWDGSSWTVQNIPASVLAMEGVSCPKISSCVADMLYNDGEPSRNIQQGGLHLIDGTWTVEAMPRANYHLGYLTAHLNGISCISAARCVAVGVHDGDGGRRTMLIFYWNGTIWRHQNSAAPFVKQDALGVSCAAHAGCTAVGLGIAVVGGPGAALVISNSAG